MLCCRKVVTFSQPGSTDWNEAFEFETKKYIFLNKKIDLKIVKQEIAILMQINLFFSPTHNKIIEIDTPRRHRERCDIVFLWAALSGETHMLEARREIEGSGEAEAEHSRGWWMTTRRSGGCKMKPCPRAPARPCVQHVSCVIVRDRTACTALRSWQAQKEIAYPEETPRGQSKSIPDQQLEKTQRTQVTSAHLRCCWELCATSSTASPLPLICIFGLRRVLF